MNIWKKWIIKWGASIQETWEIKKIYVLKNASYLNVICFMALFLFLVNRDTLGRTKE